MPSRTLRASTGRPDCRRDAAARLEDPPTTSCRRHIETSTKQFPIAFPVDNESPQSHFPHRGSRAGGSRWTFRRERASRAGDRVATPPEHLSCSTAHLRRCISPLGNAPTPRAPEIRAVRQIGEWAGNRGYPTVSGFEQFITTGKPIYGDLVDLRYTCARLPTPASYGIFSPPRHRAQKPFVIITPISRAEPIALASSTATRTRAHLRLEPFRHPQLGELELGHGATGRANNPPYEIRRNLRAPVAAYLRVAGSLPGARDGRRAARDGRDRVRNAYLRPTLDS